MQNNTVASLARDIELLSLITQAPISLLSKEGDTLFCPTLEEHHYVSADMAKYVLMYFFEKKRTLNAPYIHLFSLQILLGVVQVSKNDFIFIGPVCITKTSLDHSLETFGSIVNKEETLRLHSLLEHYGSLDFFRFAGILASISNHHNHTDFTATDIINFNFKQKIDVKPLTPINNINSNEIPISSIHYFLNSLSSIIATGNMDALVKHWQDNVINSIIDIDILSDNILFFCIPFYAYMFQGAQKGGADLNLCFEKYTEQVNRFKQAQDMIECITELKRSSYEYCNLVMESQKREYMPDICSKCVSYINDHIHEKITVDDLTHICGIHRNKLYKIFSAHFNMTIAEYIENERLNRAIVYLEASNYSLSEIASALGYANQSHFTQIFKKHYGCTPGQYVKK